MLQGVTPANTNPMPTPNPAITEPTVETPPQPVVETPPDPSPQPDPTAPSKAELPEPPEKTDQDDLPYEATGNEYIDSVLQQYHEAGVDFDKAFSKFAETGNEADINIEYLESLLGKAAVSGHIAGIKAENAKIEQYAQEETKKVHDAVGGPDNWNALCEWIKSGESGLTKEGWAEYNEMLTSGGIKAQLAAKELFNVYKNSPGFVQNIDLVNGDATAQPGQLQPISRAEYITEFDKVVRTKGEHSPEAQLLNKRREYSMSKGL